MKPALSLLPALFVIALPVLAEAEDRLLQRASRYFEALPAAMPGAEQDSAEKIALGKKLFFDTRLSINDSQSCASCHRLENNAAGVDNLPTSPGARGEFGTRNSPTVLNAGWQRLQFWDGRASDLAEQARGPILNPVEMGMPDEQTVVTKIGSIPDYQNAFNTAFPDSRPALSYQNIAEAIAAFERTLITPSRFDDFLRGDSNALTEIERRGLASFIKANCVSCHDGKLLGGEALEKLGQKHPYSNQKDQGLYSISKDENDRMVFKVAALRNVSLTAPYFHDGQISTLEEAVKLMAKLQLDISLNENEINDIVSFLKALTDKKRAP